MQIAATEKCKLCWNLSEQNISKQGFFVYLGFKLLAIS